MVSKQRQIELIKELADIFEELEWMVAIPTDSDTCKGLIAGEKDFVVDVTRSHYGEDAEIVVPNSETSKSAEDKQEEANLELHPEKKTIH